MIKQKTKFSLFKSIKEKKTKSLLASMITKQIIEIKNSKAFKMKKKILMKKSQTCQ